MIRDHVLLSHWEKQLTIFLSDFAFLLRSAVAVSSDIQVLCLCKAYLMILQVIQFRPDTENITFLTLALKTKNGYQLLKGPKTNTFQ